MCKGVLATWTRSPLPCTVGAVLREQVLGGGAEAHPAERRQRRRSPTEAPTSAGAGAGGGMEGTEGLGQQEQLCW